MNTPATKFFFSDTDAEITLHAAALIIAEAYRALAAHKRFSLVLAGGNSPRLLYTHLAEGVTTELLERYGLPVPEKIPKNNHILLQLPRNTRLFTGDERCVPISHSDSNYRMITETLLPKSGIPEDHLIRMDGENSDTELAAREYETAIRLFFHAEAIPLREGFPIFDLVVLGLGTDGHTASLFADNAEALQEKRRWVIAVNAPKAKPPGKRLTITLPVINNAANVLFFTPGNEKKRLAEKIFFEQEKSVPASYVKPKNGNLFWFTTSKFSPPIQARMNEPDTNQESDLQQLPE